MISEQNYATIAADGDSPWVPVGDNGGVISVDCVNDNGDSADWGGASAALLYSPDGKMRCAAKENGVAITGTDGFSYETSRGGFVAIAVSDYSSGTFKVVVS
jgi:hypothetical protein